MSKIYRYQDLDGVHDVSREAILGSYYKYWCANMKRLGKEDQINEEACIQDFLVIHWAYEVKDE